MVREGATLGANATILCGITIGEYAFIGAGAVVTRDVPPYGLVYGNPARLKGWMCRCGVKLVFRNNKAVCSACSEKYKVSNGIIKCIGKG
jgi:UDP-2-acetamido-3-amino-2,3-dideoxy-glucuronate N-acetyltransferase